MSEPFKIVKLDSGLTVSFFDFSNRYFGDFHRVCLELKIIIPLQLAHLPVELAQAAEKLSEPLCFERRLERMGVAGQELQTVKDKLIDDFLANCSCYLNQPNFAQQLLAKKLKKRL